MRSTPPPRHARLDFHTVTSHLRDRAGRIRKRSRRYSRRSRAATVLLFGWLFFWMVGIIQPCCTALAGSHDDGPEASPAAPSENGASSGLPAIHSHENDQCPGSFTPDTAMRGEYSLLLAKAENAAPLIVRARFTPFLAVSLFPNSIALYHPFPPPRIFLRTQRLLI